MGRAFLMVVIALALAVLVVAGAVWLDVHRAASNEDGVVRVTVPKGLPLSLLTEQLHNRGLLRRPWTLKAYAAALGHDKKIKSGTYEFDAGDSPAAILDRLVAGDILKVSVTIPEGFMMWEIAEAFTAAGADSVEMLAAIRDAGARARRQIESQSLEGYLFPDTYHVAWAASPAEIVAQMLARLDEVFTPELIVRAAELEMTPHQVLTLASIVEAEARVPGERAQVAAVYHNRLKRRMRLEADPTVAYAMDGYRGRLLYADLEIDSPYNTYRNYGLPPGPICSPGEAAIRAALYPDPDTKAVYFVARGDGSHIFSLTLREHQAAVEQLRRVQRDARRKARQSPSDTRSEIQE